MVARITELGAAQSTVHYFERDGYYARNDPEHRRASFWHGRAAAALGLRGHVHPTRFEEVLAGYVRRTRIRLGRKRGGEHQHRPGLDLTFSASKSVSLEALLFGERRVVRAHDEAVRETLDWIEAELLQTRGHDPATGRRPRVRAHGMVVAGFRHLTSRNQDPQLHTHCVIANMTRNADGAWRSLETTKLRRSEKLIGAYYRNALARRLQALGYAISPTMVGRVPGFEIAGYDRAMLDAFSSRRFEILAALAANGLPYTAELAQMAALSTRRRKVDVGLGALVPKWRARARELGLSRSPSQARPPRPLDPGTGRRSPRVRIEPPALPPNVVRNRRRAPAVPGLSPERTLERLSPANARPGAPALLLPEPERGVLEVVARAVAELEERTTVFAETEVRALALGAAPGRYTLGEVDSGLAALVRDGELVEVERRGGEPAFVTHRALGLERHLIKTMRSGRGEGRALAEAGAAQARLSRTGLTPGQRAAALAIALSPDWLIGVQGHAGAGKTTMLREAAGLPGMARVHGLAPSSSAVRALGREAGIEARTLSWFLTRFEDLSDPRALARGRELYAGTVLAVDEASMVGTVAMEALVRTARALGVARVVLVGDTRQLRAVDAGQPFRVLQRAGMTTTVMDEVLRQRDPGLAAAVAHARDGHPELALRTLAERVHETPRELLGDAAGRVWLALPPEARAATEVLAPTHAIRRAIHDTVREGLAAEGVLQGRALTVERLIDRRLTRAEAADLRSYGEGDEVVFHRDVYGCRKDDVCRVVRIDGGRVVLEHPGGALRRFRPSGNAARNLGLFDTAPIELRAGDRIRWTRNRAAPRARGRGRQAPELVNGDTARVLTIDDRRVHFRTEHGARLALARSDPQLRHLDHAYSSTVHAAQGKTARAVIAVLESTGLADQTLLYVEMSRASEDFVLLTDDREALADTLARRPGREEGALEAIGESLGAPPVVEPEVFERLRADWSAVRERARANGELAYLADGYREVLSRAAALSAIEDLPADIARFTGALLARHRANRARESKVQGLVQRMQAHWRRWPELGWAAGKSSAKETSGHREWRHEADAMLDTARAWLGGEGDLSPHLDAMPGAWEALETAVRQVERTRVRDDLRIFEREWGAARSRGAPLLHLFGYARVARLGEALSDTESLSPAERSAVDEWRGRHEAEVASHERVERYPREVAALVEERRNLHMPEDPDEGDPARPEHRKWQSDCEELLAEGEAMLRTRRDTLRYIVTPTSNFRRHLDAMRALEEMLADDARRAFEWLSREVGEAAEASGFIPFHAPRYEELAEWGESLASMAGLPEATRRRVDEWRAGHEECLRRRAEIEAYPDRVEVLRMTRDGTREAWRREAFSLAESGRAMLAGAPAYRPHLDAMPGARAEVAESLRTVHGLLELSGVLEAADARFIVPCLGRVLEGDRVRAVVHGPPRTGYESRGEKMTIEGEIGGVASPAGPDDDLVLLRVTASSGESGPEAGSTEWLSMRTLFEYGCERTVWEDEEERARREAADRREVAERERMLEAARERGRQRHHGRGEDRDISW